LTPAGAIFFYDGGRRLPSAANRSRLAAGHNAFAS
jgi:hypothetical protein